MPQRVRSTNNTGLERFRVSDDDDGCRLDKFLAARSEDLSRSRLQALIRDGRVKVDGTQSLDAGSKVRAGQIVDVDVPEPEPIADLPQPIALDVVFEDQHLIVINKPAGLVVHPAPGHRDQTLVNALLAHCGASLSGIGGARRPGIVHRLDKETSGLLVVAKTDQAHKGLSSQFKSRGEAGALKRNYMALVWSGFDRPHGTIDAPIGRAPHNRTKMAVVAPPAGREAITHYQVIKTFGEAGRPPLATLAALRLETGRTHQIRVHVADRGHPILGDKVYGAGFKASAKLLSDAARQALIALNRQALHAAGLTFLHPVSGEKMEFQADLPDDMQRLLDALDQ